MSEAFHLVREETEQKPMLKWVDVSSFDQNEQVSKAIAAVICENGQVRFENKGHGEAIIKKLQDEGIMSPEGEKLFPKHGELFLNALSRILTDPELLASPVHEGDKIKPYEPPAFQNHLNG